MKQTKPDRISEQDLDILLARAAAAGKQESAPPVVRRRLLAEFQFRAGIGEPLEEGRHSGFALAGMAAALLTVALASLGYFALDFGNAMPFLHGSAAVRWQEAKNHVRSLFSFPSSSDTATPKVSAALAAATDYVSLPYSDPSLANGTETTVRVSLPASELMAWGVPPQTKEPGNPDERVSADLVLGDDGLPMAIRLDSSLPLQAERER